MEWNMLTNDIHGLTRDAQWYLSDADETDPGTSSDQDLYSIASSSEDPPGEKWNTCKHGKAPKPRARHFFDAYSALWEGPCTATDAAAATPQCGGLASSRMCGLAFWQQFSRFTHVFAFWALGL